MKRSKRKVLPKSNLGRMTEKLEYLKASVRVKVEHPFTVTESRSPSLLQKDAKHCAESQGNGLEWLAGRPFGAPISLRKRID